MNNRIVRLICGLVAASIGGFVIFFYSEVSSIKRHPDGITDRVFILAEAIVWEPSLLFILLPAAAAVFLGAVISVRAFFHLDSALGGQPADESRSDGSR